MKALIISASKFETQYLSSKFNIFTLDNLSEIPNTHNVLITGAGVLDTIFAISEALNKIQADIIINMGIAGTLNSDLKIGTNCIVKSDFILDSGIYRDKNFKHISEFEFSINKTKIYNASAEIKNLVPECLEVNAQTVNLFYNLDLNNRPEAYKTTNADIETMEGAAVFYVANQKSIPVCSIRTISNYIGEKYNATNYEAAVKQNCLIIEKLIEKLNAN
ncbi:MAG: hypothetical protein GX879_09915 [Bacteroidales bacterium]|nr:hypothetical protein [Bacteroidales bacterium]